MNIFAPLVEKFGQHLERHVAEVVYWQTKSFGIILWESFFDQVLYPSLKHLP